MTRGAPPLSPGGAGARVALATIALALSACGVREEGLTLDVVAAISSPLALADGGAASFTEASLRVSSIELKPCPSTAANVWRWLSPVGTAWAHGDSPSDGPLVLRVASPVDLTRGTQLLGTLHPPPGRFCRLVARLGGLDADGGALPTLLVTGGALSLESTELRPLTLDFDALALDDAAPAATLTLDFDLGRALEGVAPASPGAAGECLSHLARDVRVTHSP